MTKFHKRHSKLNFVIYHLPRIIHSILPSPPKSRSKSFRLQEQSCAKNEMHIQLVSLNTIGLLLTCLIQLYCDGQWNNSMHSDYRWTMKSLVENINKHANLIVN